MIIGYWDTRDANGNKVLAAQGTAQWIVQASPDYTLHWYFYHQYPKGLLQ